EQSMSLFCGLLDPLEGNLHYANAGHPPPQCWRARTGAVEILPTLPGLPLGLDPHAAYHHKRTLMGAGDVVVLYNDGVTSAQDRNGMFFGQERLDAAVRDLAPQGAQALRSGLIARVEEFLDEQDPQDDVTLLVLQRHE